METARFEPLIHIRPMLQKTPVNDLDNPILLLFRHLVIAGKAQSTPENIGSYVDSRAFYVGVSASPTVTFYCDERTGAVYRLHMHGLTNRSSFCIESSGRIQYFMR